MTKIEQMAGGVAMYTADIAEKDSLESISTIVKLTALDSPMSTVLQQIVDQIMSLLSQTIVLSIRLITPEG